MTMLFFEVAIAGVLASAVPVLPPLEQDRRAGIDRIIALDPPPPPTVLPSYEPPKLPWVLRIMSSMIGSGNSNSCMRLSSSITCSVTVRYYKKRF